MLGVCTESKPAWTTCKDRGGHAGYSRGMLKALDTLCNRLEGICSVAAGKNGVLPLSVSLRRCSCWSVVWDSNRQF